MKFSIKGFDQVRNAIAGWSNRLRDLGPAYQRAALVVLTAAQNRIRSKNDGSWPASVETDRGTTLFRTGALMRSLTVGGAGNLMQDLGNGIRVGTNLRTPDDRFSIGVLQQFGTGPIVPRNGKFLVFEINGQKVFSKGTKGIPARPFLFIDDDDAQRVRDVFAAHISGGKS